MSQRHEVAGRETCDKCAGRGYFSDKHYRCYEYHSSSVTDCHHCNGLGYFGAPVSSLVVGNSMQGEKNARDERRRLQRVAYEEMERQTEETGKDWTPFQQQQFMAKFISENVA